VTPSASAIRDRHLPSEVPPPSAPALRHLIAIDATTGVGGTAPVTMAAARAGLTRTKRVSHGPGEGDWSHAVRVGTLTTSDPEARADALLGAALAQVVPRVSAMGSCAPSVACSRPCPQDVRVARVVQPERRARANGRVGVRAASSERRARRAGQFFLEDRSHNKRRRPRATSC
jgi:hypothetical protein